MYKGKRRTDVRYEGVNGTGGGRYTEGRIEELEDKERYTTRLIDESVGMYMN